MATHNPDTIRVLVATDNHVGYAERDATRGNDSHRSFDEIMRLAKDQDVDMVLLAGDLFHDNKPSRKSMYEVMKSLRMNCFGPKPCELQMLSDATEVFQGTFNNANYEDEDLNVAIPVFSIHGNHDDPSGEGHFAALDLLQVSGLVNYYGRTPEADNIEVKPVLLQKGRTKLALYGLSNVRDERLFRTFRDGKVKFFQPGSHKSEWFNILSVHQNHHAYTDTGYLPENFIPNFMNLVIWGHEHECAIDPRLNHDMGFHVMQPGSSVATSLMPGEAVPKHVAILSITGKEFKSETIRLKTVRPFVMREIVLQSNKNMLAIAKKADNRTAITKYLIGIVEEMIDEAVTGWSDLQDDLPEDKEDWPKPLIRLRVEYTAPDGGRFDCENPQRFSNRFSDRVANVNDVVQYHRKKKSGQRASTSKPDMPDDEVIAQMSLDNVKVDELVREFLKAQSLTILPQNSFGDAVGQFVEKDDKHAVTTFITDSLDSQVKHLMSANDMDEEGMVEEMETYRTQLEEAFKRGEMRLRPKSQRERPDDWDSDFDEEEEEANDTASVTAAGRKKAASKTTSKANGTTRKTAVARKPAVKMAATGGRSRKKVVSEDEDDDEGGADVMTIDDNDDDIEEEEESQGLFVGSSKTQSGRTAASRATPVRRSASPKRKAPARTSNKTTRAGTGRQATLNFSQQPAPSARPSRTVATREVEEISDDDDDAFEPVQPSRRR